jgi:hypothetical protein
MTTKYYALHRQYILPQGSFSAIYMDGIYIDGTLFSNNIPVIDGTIRIDIMPQNPDAVDRWADLGFPTFNNGQVVRVGHKFYWGPANGVAQYYDIPYNGHPYGMGLNTIAVQLSLSPLPIFRDIIFKIDFTFVIEVQ